ncbi:MAG: hypothetical protein JST75_08035 [Bacteroidetes bacterium]|nr:hypothetical protein [Bacteroidota bacterium]
MFIGHFGLGLASKKVDKRVSLGTYFLAAQFLDLIWPVFLLLSWEKAEPIPNGPPLENLNFVSYPYSHSLFFALIWGLIFSIVHYVRKKEIKTAIFLGFLVVSHWILDFFTHVPDLPLVPWSNYKVGLGLWDHEAATIIIESLMLVAGIAIFLKNTLLSKKAYASLFIELLLLVGIYVSSLFSPPPTSIDMLAKFALALWLFIVWAYLIDPGLNKADQGLK